MRAFDRVGKVGIAVLAFGSAIWGVAASTSSPPASFESVLLGDNPNRINQLRSLKVADLKVAGTTIHAWLMDNDSKREEGMMFLTDREVKSNQGMLFVFPDVQSSQNSFWMHNCPMGLDIIYIDSHKRVVNVGDGRPENDSQVTALRDYRWVLELKRGWSKKHGLKPGDRISIPPGIHAIE